MQYSNQVATDWEAKEALGVESDVWRSKYLASSVIVEELDKSRQVGRICPSVKFGFVSPGGRVSVGVPRARGPAVAGGAVRPAAEPGREPAAAVRPHGGLRPSQPGAGRQAGGRAAGR